MPAIPTHQRDRCRACGALLPAWLGWAQEPDGALLLGHLRLAHRDVVGGFLARMHTTDDVAPVAAEAYDLVEVEGPTT